MINPCRRLAICLVIIIGLVTAAPALAQPKPALEPSSTHIFPAGGRRGTTVKVRVGAECIPPGTHFHITGQGIKASTILDKSIKDTGESSPRRRPTEIPITYPREWQNRITIAGDAPLGPAYWRLHCASGGTASRPFLIGDLPEYIEQESNSALDRANRVTLPVTLNGQIHGERDVDYYQFTAHADGVVSCEVIAGRIGSPLDPIVEVLNAEGSPIAVQEVHVGRDPVLAFQCKRNGKYLLRIANVSRHGGPNYVYRINVSTRPFAYAAFPAGGRRGSVQDVAFLTLTGTSGFHRLTRKVAFPNQPDESFDFADKTGLTASLALDSLSNVNEKEPNNEAQRAMKLAVPQTVNGRLSTRFDADWFQFHGKQGQPFTMTCQAFPPGGQALPTLLLTDASGNRLAFCRSTESLNGECRLEWTVPENGLYFLRVQDLRHGSFGGPEFIYRLSVSHAKADFALELPSDGLNVVQGGQSQLKLTVHRRGGFDSPIQLQWKELPEGVSATPTTIPAGARSASITISAADDVASRLYPVSIVGMATIDKSKVKRTVMAGHLGVDAHGIAIGPSNLPVLHLAVKHKPLFRLTCSEAYLYAHRGTVFPYPMEVERLEGYKGPIKLQRGDRQNRDMDGVEMWNAVVPPGKSRVVMPIYLPETMHINVQSQTQLYTQGYVSFVDKHNQKQSMLFLSEKRNMLRTLPPVVKLAAEQPMIPLAVGESVEVKLQLKRTPNFSGPLEIELLDPDDHIQAEKITIPAGQSAAAVKVHARKSAQPGSRVKLRFRGRGILKRGTALITETVVIGRVE